MKRLKFGLIFVLLSLAFVLAVAGCAKKNKPDVDTSYSDALKSAVQDKDMNFGATGSDSGQIEGLYSVHFDYDASNLTSEARDVLVKDATWLKQHQNKGLQIEGHCDRHGSTEYNLALGQRRANAVKKYLVNLGVQEKRLSTISYGKEKMLDVSETDEADIKNRRANFKPLEDSPKANRLTNL
jgi:peptidoglycan-associated lipoprotein